KTDAFGTKTVNASTVASVPTKTPTNCAMNCLRGFAPSKYPLLRSVSRSAEEAAALVVMLALIRLTFMFPGLIAPNVSWVTLPIAPMGVVSVSPVTRQATSASPKERTTARTLCQYGMPKEACASKARAMSETTWPAMNQEPGTSIASTSEGVFFSLAENIPPRLRKARRAVRHCIAKLSKPDATMHEVPPHRVHWTTSLKPEPVITPRCWKKGTKTAQHSVPLMKVLSDTRMPVIAPAATKMGSQEKMTVRPLQTLN